MVLTVPEELKGIKSYIKRAEELDHDTSSPNSKIVAYCCRSFALEKAMNIRSGYPKPSEIVDGFLAKLMSIIESEKKALSSKASPQFCKDICEQFAFTVFAKADEQDLAGSATKETAQTFYAAANFLEVCTQFDDPSKEIPNKLKYAKWKAADILKAIKEGRTPLPGSPREYADDSMIDAIPNNNSNNNSNNNNSNIMPPPNTLNSPPTIPDHYYSPPLPNNPSNNTSSLPMAPDSLPSIPSLPLSNIPPSHYNTNYPPNLLPPPSYPDHIPTNNRNVGPGGSSALPPSSSSSTSSPLPHNTNAYPPNINTNNTNNHYYPSPGYTPPGVNPNIPPPHTAPYRPPNYYPPAIDQSNINASLPGGRSTGSGTGTGSKPVTTNDPRCKDAQELCAFGMAALKVGDINLAKARLQEALRKLG